MIVRMILNFAIDNDKQPWRDSGMTGKPSGAHDRRENRERELRTQKHERDLDKFPK
jgi:hypothetical protein